MKDLQDILAGGLMMLVGTIGFCFIGNNPLGVLLNANEKVVLQTIYGIFNILLFVIGSLLLVYTLLKKEKK